MFTRRSFLLTGSLATAGIALGGSKDFFTPHGDLISKRPAIKDRKFTSEAVEATIVRMKKELKDPELAWLFENCFPNTLDTTIAHYSLEGKPDTFVITGDIDAMWLRDSTAQVWPYIPLVKEDKKLSLLIQGVINRQAKCVLIDPYANAFNYEATGSEWKTDITAMKPELHERKWEVDSLCYVVRLSYRYWKVSGNKEPYDAAWVNAMRLIVKTFKEQQRKENDGPYSFRRKTDSPHDTAQGTGFGNPVQPIGLICSVFRPSDDGTIFPFLIPANFFAVTSLKQLAEMMQAFGETVFAAECISLANEIQAALDKYAVVPHEKFGSVYAYEIDGYGSHLLMDDANVPSLLSLPYIAGISNKDEIYRNTRKMALSNANPYYASGRYSGVGGPHTGKQMIWPLSYIMRAITSDDKAEIGECIRLLKATHGGTGFMHESFDRNDPSVFTRSWFAWANTIFGELLLTLQREHKL